MDLLLTILRSFFDGFILPLCHASNKGSYSTIPNLTGKVDDAFMLVLVISVVLLALVTFFMLYFAIRYRSSKNPRSEEVTESVVLEITWTVIPTVLVFIMFYVGWENFVAMRKTPDDTIPVTVRARMWSWTFEYENGLKSDALRVPTGRPVKLSITSDDVIHSLFIPDLKLKEDAVPGMETSLWIVTDHDGEYDILCAEYCGERHSYMMSKVISLSGEEFEDWYNEGLMAKAGPADAMSILDDNGCLDCHSVDGSEEIGPTFKGIFGRTSIVLSKGQERTITADEQYLKRSVLYPEADIVKGYPEVMPSFEGEIFDKDLMIIIEYFKELT